eukprot:6181998-Pleurochrysis_carterae.AAC.1
MMFTFRKLRGVRKASHDPCTPIGHKLMRCFAHPERGTNPRPGSGESCVITKLDAGGLIEVIAWACDTL